MGFQRFDPDAPRHDEPQLTIYGHLSGYVNAAADYQWFADYDAVIFHVDREATRLAIEPATAEEGDYSLSRERDTLGADLSTRYPLVNELGFDDDTLDDSVFVDLEWDDDRGWAVADLEPLLDDGSDGGTERSPNTGGDTTDSDDGTKWCGACGKMLTSARGVSVHHGKADDGDHTGPADIRDEPPEDDEGDDQDGKSDPDIDEDEPVVRDDADADAAVPDPEDSVSNETVRDCAEQVDTLSELGELLDVSNGEARLLARDAGVLREIDDDHPRMGATHS